MATGRLERLVSLMNLLLDTRRPLAAHEIHVRVPGYPEGVASFHRQFERDKEELRDMGLPLVMEPVPAADPPLLGYRIDRCEATQPPADLDADELEALNLAAALVGFTGGLGRRAMFKLGGAAASVAQRAEVADDPNLVAVFSAVVDRCRLHLRYRGEDREIDPHRIEFARGRWYLRGFDHRRGAARWYRVGRIEGTVTADAPGSAQPPATPAADLTLDPWALPGDHPPVTAEVWFDPVAATGVRDLPGIEVVSDGPDGLVVRLAVHHRDGFRSWLLTFLDRAEVRGPADLRSWLVQWLEAVAAVDGADTGTEDDQDEGDALGVGGGGGDTP
jgi:predicted DNA-binding transcriptional regulator YafY